MMLREKDGFKTEQCSGQTRLFSTPRTRLISCFRAFAQTGQVPLHLHLSTSSPFSKAQPRCHLLREVFPEPLTQCLGPVHLCSALGHRSPPRAPADPNTGARSSPSSLPAPRTAVAGEEVGQTGEAARILAPRPPSPGDRLSWGPEPGTHFDGGGPGTPAGQFGAPGDHCQLGSARPGQRRGPGPPLSVRARGAHLGAGLSHRFLGVHLRQARGPSQPLPPPPPPPPQPLVHPEALPLSPAPSGTTASGRREGWGEAG
uniref:Uncharacterized protein LOC110207324 n=1 Tax=Phascolarctos cinereus TaxID=38626 RepID=A0A6P5K5K7_PHACI|nr:uncharacterized protein LOC110207324 [Phascolarctos cinereus]